MEPTRAAYDEVYVYTMGRPGFILQHVVDAFAVQNANPEGPLISVVFGLVGLCLHIERKFSGRQVQEVHKKLGRTERRWPTIHFPADRGRMTALDVVAAPEGPARDRAIHDWCESVWNAFQDNREVVIGLLKERHIG